MKIKYPSILASTLVILASCARAPHTSSLADVTLHFDNGQLGLVYHAGANVYYRVCAPGTITVTRKCDAPQGEKTLGYTVYTEALQRSLGATDPAFLGPDALAKVQDEIKFTESRVSDPSLSPEELGRAQQRLTELKDTELKLLKADSVLKFLESGKDVVYSSSFSEIFGKITEPFGGATNTIPDNAISDRNNGYIWTELGSMCWWDAAGLRREIACKNEVKKGCKLGMGPAWDLPTVDQLQRLGATVNQMECMWTKDGGAVQMLNGGISLPSCLHVWSQESLAQPVPTYCVAPAKLVDPDGDIDEDGIINRDDKCNKKPADLTSPIWQDGPYKGCAAGQSVDSVQ